MKCGLKPERICPLVSGHCDKQGHVAVVAWAEVVVGRRALTRERGMSGLSKQQRLPGRSSTGVPRTCRLNEILQQRWERTRMIQRTAGFHHHKAMASSFSGDGRQR